MGTTEMADFCLDVEGWGPVSRLQYAFTPCFQDGILCAVPGLFLLVAGTAQLWRYSHSGKLAHARNAIYWTKILLIFALLGLNIALTTLRWRESRQWQRDVFVWSALLKVFVTGLAFSLHHLEHVRNASPVACGVLLLYWLGIIVVDAIKEYEIIIADVVHKQRLYFVVFSFVLAGEVLIFCLEYFVPRTGRAYRQLLQSEEEDDGAEPCPESYADIFSVYYARMSRSR
jgi:ATP-binding cassette, subfamily C (CFTR/MRP), member 1